MSDVLGDIYPIPVEWVDGQQPTAAFLNAWANQIDFAFMLLSRVIGDFDGTGEAPETYISNLIRAIGPMGWINTRLPRDCIVAAGKGGGVLETLPLIYESLAAFEGEKLATLSFIPSVEEANDADFSYPGNAGAAKPVGASIGSVLQEAARFALDGKSLFTSDPIEVADSVLYPVDTSGTKYKDAYSLGTGANIIPNIYEIVGEGDLCTITKPGGYGALEFKISFPQIRRVMNPRDPTGTTDGSIINLGDVDSDIRWVGLSSDDYDVPEWRIPLNILALLSGTLLPYGTVSLWHSSGGAISRIRPTFSVEQIRFDIIAGDITTIKITIPEGFDLPALPGDDTDNRYILGFGGTSVTEAIVHERARQLLHSHDGLDGELVSALNLKDSFDPSKWGHSSIYYNPFPQYLERGGYTAGDTVNGKNVMLGNLVIGPTSATPTSHSSVADLTVDSYKLVFGDPSSGPYLVWGADDSVGADDGKLTLVGATRINGNLYLGASTIPPWLDAIAYDTGGGDYRFIYGMYPDVGDGAMPTGVEAWWSAFTLRARSTLRIGDGTADTDGADDTVLSSTSDVLTIEGSGGEDRIVDVEEVRTDTILPRSGEATIYIDMNPKTDISWYPDGVTDAPPPFDNTDGPAYTLGHLGVHCETEIFGEGLIRLDAAAVKQFAGSNTTLTLDSLTLYFNERNAVSITQNAFSEFYLRIREADWSDRVILGTELYDYDTEITVSADGQFTFDLGDIEIDFSKSYYLQLLINTGIASYVLQNIRFTAKLTETA